MEFSDDDQTEIGDDASEDDRSDTSLELPQMYFPMQKDIETVFWEEMDENGNVFVVIP